MGGLSVMHWVLLAGVATLMFGKGRLSGVMGDAAKGIKAFKAGLADAVDRPSWSTELKVSTCSISA